MKNICRIFCLFWAVWLCFALSSAAFAEAAGRLLNDEAGLLSYDEFVRLSEKLGELSAETGIDIAVSTEERMNGPDERTRAEYIIESRTGTEPGAVLLYISGQPRRYWLAAEGTAYEMLGGGGIEYIDQRILPYLESDDYAGAVEMYADAVYALLSPSESASYTAGMSPAEILTTVAAVILLPLIAAFVMTGAKLRQMNTAQKAVRADTYIKNGSFDITDSRDIFLFSTVTRRRRERRGTAVPRGRGNGAGRGGGY